ncbi:hypothetical protein D6D28_05898 [Aureobasidium pullulans]|uniref:Uncharacterized protein n=1 Tax=Aureobasidium pullulans TaxID=5580 RepID=A0A4S8SFY2_AURPU|nr:hypothetical protein D6D28_05898 [Aureobasidium pullulans]
MLQRQILLTWLRIFFTFGPRDRESVTMEDLRLPWSSPAPYPGEVLTLSEDYINWYASLLPEHPWDACIVLGHMNFLRPPNISIRNFEDESSIEASLYARMMMLGTLLELELVRRCGPFIDENRPYRDVFPPIVSNLESEKLAKSVGSILQQHSESQEVTGTRPYKRLQLLMIDHHTLCQQQAESVGRVVDQTLLNIEPIEEYAMSPEVRDHRLGIDVLFHYRFLIARKDPDRVMLNKIGRFTSCFGITKESTDLQSSLSGPYYQSAPFPNRSRIMSFMTERLPSDEIRAGQHSMFAIILAGVEEDKRGLTNPSEVEASENSYDEGLENKEAASPAVSAYEKFGLDAAASKRVAIKNARLDSDRHDTIQQQQMKDVNVS